MIQISQGLQITSSASALIFRNTTERLRSIRFPLSVQGSTNWSSQWSLDIADPVTKSDFKLHRHKSKVWSPKRNTTKPLGFVLCPSPQMCSKTSDLLKTCLLGKKCKENLGKSSSSGPMWALDLWWDRPSQPPNPPKWWLWVPRQIPLFESGKHDHGPSCSSCPSLSMKEGMWFRAIFSLASERTCHLKCDSILLYFCHSVLYLAVHACSSLSIAISNARLDSTSRSLIIEFVFACFSGYFHPDPSTPSQWPTLHLSLGRSQVFVVLRSKTKFSNFTLLPSTSEMHRNASDPGAPDSRRRHSRCCHRCPENEALCIGMTTFRKGLFLEMCCILPHSYIQKAQNRRRPATPISDEIAKDMLLPTTKIQNHSEQERVVIAKGDS